MDEGYIKFQADWQPASAPPIQEVAGLMSWRQKMYAEGWIGQYDNGIGFGNMSQRSRSEGFWITGSATGGNAQIRPEHFSKVTQWNIDKNQLKCEGPVIASSESMTHAIIYQTLMRVQAVFHIHDLACWQRGLDALPSTGADIPYGTPEMARAVESILKAQKHPEGLIAMAGHKEGLIAYGSSLAKVGQLVLNFCKGQR